MPGSGTRTFLDPADYETSLRQVQIEAVIAHRGEFRARLTWAELQDFQVLRCEEDFPRAAYLSFGPRRAFVTVPEDTGAPPMWRGTRCGPGEIMFHARGARLHQSTPASCVWNIITLEPAQLEHYGQALSGKPFSLPEGKILRPPRRDIARLLRLHAQVCRLAETRPRILLQAEVAHAIEQGLIQALVTCLTTARVGRAAIAGREHADIMTKLEVVLAEHPGESLPMPLLCQLTGVTERALHASCSEFCGMSARRYVLLRRLRQARVALRRADPGAVDLPELARSLGFRGLRRFNTAYRAAFGELPSTTVERIVGSRFATR
jgi:AraC-like DNA-binding protein